MDFKTKLAAAISKRNSLLCVGLDPDIGRMPTTVAKNTDALFVFNKAIIDATAEFTCAFKPNCAFYEAQGEAGLEQLQKTTEYICTKYPDIPIIVDAKRGDIGNTNNGYAAYVFDHLRADAVTLHPYLGAEALQPFLDRADKGIIILCRTSNPGAGEFQDLVVDGAPLYQHVATRVAKHWNTNNNCLLVVGATYPAEMKTIRDIIGPDMWLLVPGVGAQGGDIAQAVQAGLAPNGQGMLLSCSREVLYASSSDDFAAAAHTKAMQLRDTINQYR